MKRLIVKYTHQHVDSVQYQYKHARSNQYEFSLSMRLINVFRDKVFSFAAGISQSWAWAQSLLLALLTGGNRWWRTCLGFLRMSPNIRLSARLQIFANGGWLFGRNLPFTAFFSTFSRLSRPWASSRPHHAWDTSLNIQFSFYSSIVCNVV